MGSIRFDAAAVSIRATPVEVRPDGFRVYVGTAGFGNIVQKYPDLVPPRNEFRPEEEALADETLRSAIGMILTSEHPDAKDTPSGLLIPETAKQHCEGAILDAWKENEKFRVKVIAYTRDLQRELESGTVDLSLGYTQDLDPTPGVYKGQRYDGVQRNIRINHLAVVRNARAVRPDGERARLDSPNAIVSLPYPANNKANMDITGLSPEAMQILGQLGEADMKVLKDLIGAVPSEEKVEEKAAEKAEDVEQDKKMIAPLEDKVMDLESRLAKIEEMLSSMQDSKARKDSEPTVVNPIVDAEAVIAKAEKSAQARFDASAKFVGAVTNAGHKANTVDDAAAVMIATIKENLPGLHNTALQDLKSSRLDSLTNIFKEADRIRGEKLVNESAAKLFQPIVSTPEVALPIVRF